GQLATSRAANATSKLEHAQTTASQNPSPRPAAPAEHPRPCLAGARRRAGDPPCQIRAQGVPLGGASVQVRKIACQVLKTARRRELPRGFESHTLRSCDLSGHRNDPEPTTGVRGRRLSEGGRLTRG